VTQSVSLSFVSVVGFLGVLATGFLVIQVNQCHV
jgi:hypothetical protein